MYFTKISMATLLLLLVGALFPHSEAPAIAAPALIQQSGQDQSFYYTCPMHPSIRRSQPGACPICGMTLVKKSTESVVDSTLESRLAGVRLSPGKEVLANVATVPVSRRSINRKIHAFGTVTSPHPTHRYVTARFPGRIDRLFVNSDGERVHKGQALARIYSPEALAALDNYRLALEDSSTAQDQPAMFAERTRALIDESRKKLLLLGISPGDMGDTSGSDSAITLRSPSDGVVLAKNILLGQYVNVGDILFEVGETSELWLDAQVYEFEKSGIKPGMTMHASLQAHPDLAITTTITFVSPVVDPESRTITVRGHLNNPKSDIMIGEFADVTIDVPLPPRLVVPRGAVLSTGYTHVVWIEQKDNMFVPRRVKLGEGNDDVVQVLSGLNEGDVVVSQGGYLLDAESQLELTPAQ